MKKLLLVSATAVSILAPTLGHATTWDLDAAHTTSGFAVTHLMVTTVHGAFTKTTGTVEVDDKDVTKSKIDVTIDPSTIDTRVADRDKHLRSADFFDVEKFSTITFKSTKVEKNGEGKLKVTGDLTMHGITRPVVLDVVGPSADSKSPYGTIVRGISASGKISRKEFGLVWNKVMEGGGVAVSDEVALDINAELVKHAEPVKTDAKADPKK
jgi:polyisoprenoid-binding protein YceI